MLADSLPSAEPVRHDARAEDDRAVPAVDHRGGRGDDDAGRFGVDSGSDGAGKQRQRETSSAVPGRKGLRSATCVAARIVEIAEEETDDVADWNIHSKYICHFLSL